MSAVIQSSPLPLSPSIKSFTLPKIAVGSPLGITAQLFLQASQCLLVLVSISPLHDFTKNQFQSKLETSVCVVSSLNALLQQWVKSGVLCTWRHLWCLLKMKTFESQTVDEMLYFWWSCSAYWYVWGVVWSTCTGHEIMLDQQKQTKA